jgi:hypothetical protein
MANADRKHIGSGAQGKGDGTGAMTELDPDVLPENMVLSNRDKAQFRASGDWTARQSKLNSFMIMKPTKIQLDR